MKKNLLLWILFLPLIFASCPPKDDEPDVQEDNYYNPYEDDDPNPYADDDHVLIKNRYGNYYEIFVGSFYDSTGGSGTNIGNLKGIIEKLDYLNDGSPDSDTSLHIDGIWLMPITPSPSYHKYDVTDYQAIDPAYGTMEDFEDLIAGCDQRGIRVIIDLVVNHTSTQHPWFQQARSGDAKYQAYYNVVDSQPEGSVGRKYYRLGNTGKWYEAEFWDQMPDLNYDNPAVWDEMRSIVDFWIGKGVAGFRLDAVRHIYDYGLVTESKQDNVKNIGWLNRFVNYCKSKKNDVYIVSEVWVRNETIILDYYASSFPSYFNFPAAQTHIPHAIRNAQGSNFADFVVRWNTQIKAKKPSAIDAPFIGNHDIDRFPAVINSTDPVKLKMAASMMLFMPGNPFIYYGEEIGMEGRGKDEDKRGPMIWSRTDTRGQAKGPEYNANPYWNASSVSEQLADPDSILRFYIDALKLKNRYPSIHWGTPALITTTENPSVAAYRISSDGEKDVAIVHNLSDSSQTITVSGASAIGGTLNAASESAELPTLIDSSLKMPAYTSAVIEY